MCDALVPILTELPPARPLDVASDVLLLMDAEKLLASLPEEPLFDLVVTSPPYNLGKESEHSVPLEEYIAWQRRIIFKIDRRLKNTGSVCWQIGNYVENGSITPLDIEIASVFKEMHYRLRNHILWPFGQGLPNRNRFSGRYEVILWHTKSDRYTFHLDDVRIPSKYPGKRSYRGENKGKLSGNRRGKNPEDVWEIPNVNGNHVEKTAHPYQFPVGLIERLMLALTNEGDLVFDPFAGVASSGVEALLHKRHYWGCDITKDYPSIGRDRLHKTMTGEIKYRPHDKPIYDAKSSALSQIPQKWREETS